MLKTVREWFLALISKGETSVEGIMGSMVTKIKELEQHAVDKADAAISHGEMILFLSAKRKAAMAESDLATKVSGNLKALIGDVAAKADAAVTVTSQSTVPVSTLPSLIPTVTA